MEKPNEKYLQFPLFLLREMITNKEETINNIIRYGIYRYSTKFSYSIEDATKQMIYYYYRKQSELTPYLLTTAKKYIKKKLLVLDEDYNGFSGDAFNPEYEYEQLEKIFETDIEFQNNVIEFYQIHLAYTSLGVSGNKENCLKVGKEIEKQVKQNEPMPMISKSLLFEFRDKDKTEFELIQLIAFIAVKSILGTKSSVKTNKKHIVSRMFGYASIKHLPETLKPNIKALFQKYSLRYHIDKLLQTLELNWKVLTYSNNIRGMYVAMENKINIENLALIAETKKQTNRIEALKQSKKDAKEKALQQLKKRQQLK